MPAMFRFREAAHGASAVEFAIIAPIVVILLIGIMQVSLLIFHLANAYWACQLAARCAVVESDSTCNSDAAVQTYAASKFYNTPAPTFAVATAACGKEVSATITYQFSIPFIERSVTMNTKACYPT